MEISNGRILEHIDGDMARLGDRVSSLPLYYYAYEVVILYVVTVITTGITNMHRSKWRG